MEAATGPSDALTVGRHVANAFCQAASPVEAAAGSAAILPDVAGFAELAGPPADERAEAVLPAEGDSGDDRCASASRMRASGEFDAALLAARVRPGFVPPLPRACWLVGAKDCFIP